jgi:two-component system, sensor histidine kinase RpfC
VPDWPAALAIVRISNVWVHFVSVFDHSRKAAKKPPVPSRWLPGSLLNRLRGRPDTEHEIMLNRFALIGIAAIYAFIAVHFSFDEKVTDLKPFVILFCAHTSMVLILFGHLLYRPEACPPRRIAGIVIDCVMITLCIHIGHETYLWLYPFILWTILGNGFRFGNTYLFIAAGVSICLFAALMLFSPFWHRYPTLTWGCLIGLIVLPAYVSILIRKLNESVRLAEHASKAKSMFLASVSHELRTPLNAIIGMTDLMKVSRLTAEQKDFTQTISEAGHSLLGLINSVLDLSRLAVGKMPIVKERIDIYALLRRITNVTGAIAKQKNLPLHLFMDSKVPRFILGSQRQIEEIVMNLASNAVKFTKEGFVLVRVKCEETIDDRHLLVFEVMDTGIGISEDAHSAIFETFMQADESIVDHFGGTGLGLAIAKQMAERDGGSISVESAIGAGSTFTVRMYFDKVEQEGRSSADHPIMVLSQDTLLVEGVRKIFPGAKHMNTVSEALHSLSGLLDNYSECPIICLDMELPAASLTIADLIGRPDGSRNNWLIVAVTSPATGMLDETLERYCVSSVSKTDLTSGLDNALTIALAAIPHQSDNEQKHGFHARTRARILVADDNKTNQKVIGMILQKAGHSVAFADNGQTALEKLTDESFDIAFMDINMPVLNGLEASKLYKMAFLGLKQTPIYAFTADATEETSQRCRDAGLNGILTKPIETTQLLRVIDDEVMSGNTDAAKVNGQPEFSDSDGFVDVVEKGSKSDGQPIDQIVLRDLDNLGGPDFVREVVEQFSDDAVQTIAGLKRAVDSQSYREFRDELHALRSGAANVGARDVFDFCFKWREIGPDELARSGRQHLSNLELQLGHACSLLRDHVDRQKTKDAA